MENSQVIILSLIGILSLFSLSDEAYATGHYQEAGTMNPEDAKATATEMTNEDIPISVWTDKTDYTHNDMIIVTGKVTTVDSGVSVTVTVVSPLNSIVTIDKLQVDTDGSFETTLNTAGALWKYDGTYIIKVNYGSAEKSNKAKVELTGGVTFTPDFETPTTEPTQTEKIPEWVKNIFLWYGQDQVSEDELLNAIKYLIKEGIIQLD